MPGCLITFSGLDGSGKSTAARALRGYLEGDCRLRTRYVWCKFGLHPLASLHLARLLKIPPPASDTRPAGNRAGKSLLYQVYGRLLLGYHLAQVFTRVRASLKAATVICDRYIYDTMVDLQLDLGYSEAASLEVFRQKWMPEPACAFLFDLPEEIALARKPDTISIAYLRQRRSRYARLVDRFPLTVIDATRPPEQVFSMVRATIMHCCNQGSSHG